MFHENPHNEEIGVFSPMRLKQAHLMELDTPCFQKVQSIIICLMV